MWNPRYGMQVRRLPPHTEESRPRLPNYSVVLSLSQNAGPQLEPANEYAPRLDRAEMANKIRVTVTLGDQE